MPKPRDFRWIVAAFLSFTLSMTLHAAWVAHRAFPADPPPANAIAENQPQTTLTAGKKEYDAGRFAAAVRVWERAAAEFSTQNNPLGEAQALNFLSLAYQRLGEYEKASAAIAASQNAIATYPPEQPQSQIIRAQQLNTAGRLQFFLGHTENALDLWQQATQMYRNVPDEWGTLLSQINQARAMQVLGLHAKATKTLLEIEQTLDKQPDTSLKAARLLTLGNLRRQVGALEDSERILQQALEAANRGRSPQQISAILLSLGNTLQAKKQPESALNLYRQAVAAASQTRDPMLQLQAQLNQLHILLEIGQWESAESLAAQIPEPLSILPPSRPTVYAQVNLARAAICLQQKNPACLTSEELLQETSQQEIIGDTETIISILERGVEAARKLDDRRSQSYALGNLGRLYEKIGQQSAAQKHTEAALNLAQGIQASDIAYQWQWQLGRVRVKKGDKTGAIAPYTQAVRTLQSLRSDLVAIEPEVQFSFRETVEPVYRQLVALLLDSTQGASVQLKQQYLTQARQTLESLQLAELDNFFKDACLDAQPQQIDEIDPTAAVFYSVILPDRLAVILSIPGDNLRHYETPITQRQVETTLAQLQQFLSPAFSNKRRLQLSQQLYDWLIRPAQASLANREIQTLVFVLDGVLRNLPVAALYDGESYLIEKYSLALTPGLQLLAPQPLQREQIQVLSGGLTDARQGFDPLPAVELELQQIATQVSEAQVLLNGDFTESNLASQIDRVDFPVIHLATHGQFSSNSEQTFILTWDDKIQVTEFEALLQTRQDGFSTPIALLVLSACQTATGDKQAGLGLAGVAVRSGARSTLATLWSVNDASTATLVTEFYRNLLRDAGPGATDTSPPMTKAQALRQGQLALLNEDKYSHPFYWAPFVLVGNWL
ncbi:CHAT domain-containing protein [Phormidium sp. CCY1219]|uniref:CHAT domain-containing protein n=1 Tax=Phormidium sp. CCY1219 TaxID=2886104 RepID=UPI002D1EC410|nr:CHAT domain-containing protein [Phormidium sp. CCY1219]MEB3830260.1 CHAT domain-containing protein [Phormidium sp. CCY1219]